MFVPYHDSYVYIYTSFQTFSRFFMSSNEINAWGTSQGLIFQKIFASSRINSWTLQLGANHQTPFSPFLVLWSTFSFPVKHMKTASENSHFYSQNWMGFLSTGNPDIWWDFSPWFPVKIFPNKPIHWQTLQVCEWTSDLEGGRSTARSPKFCWVTCPFSCSKC